MRIKHVSITNVAGLTTFEADLGAIVLIQSANGYGKTSFLNCIKYCFSAGHDPQMARGDQEGVILIEMDEGTLVRTVVSRDKTTRSYKPADCKRWIPKREFIEQVSNALSYDPLAFLNKSDKEQIAEILRIMPIEIAAAEMEAALEPLGQDLGAEIAAGVDLAGRSPLDVVNTLRQSIYDKRTESHVAADTHEKHASELAVALRSATLDGTDWEGEVKKLNAEIGGIESAEQRLRDKLNGDIKTCIAEQIGSRDKLMLLKEQEVNRQIAKLEADLKAYKQECLTSCDNMVSAKKAECRDTFEKFQAEQSTNKADLLSRLAQAEQSRKIEIESHGTGIAIEKAKAAGVLARARQKAMTASLELIDKLKADIAARLPLPCTFYQGRICREEGGALVPISKWNEASRYQFCLKLATMAHGQAGFICIDSSGYGAFDESNRKAFMSACQKYVETEGLQFVIASVSADEALTVVNVEAESVT